MRPTHLELEGFASYRDATTIDFADADLFVLAGPTGAGKSSIIDAMTLALYGTVARYDDRRRVAPVISQGKTEARVRLDFTVGEHTYTAVRVVRRTKTGASTKEARLEQWRGGSPDDTVVLAGAADEVTAQVERLLGLSFEHFCVCVVLPQGAFQEFLHCKPGERQELLVELLDLDVYRKVGQAARDRAKTRMQEAELLQRRLDADFADATPETRRAADARVTALEQLLDEVTVGTDELVAILERGRVLGERQQEASRRARLLTEVAAPPDVDALTRGLTAARDALATAEDAADKAGLRVEEAEAARIRAGDATPLVQQRDRLVAHHQLTTEMTAATARSRTSTRELEAATTARTTAAAERDTAAARLEDARRADLAATLAATLHAGDDCPVCHRPLDADPDEHASADVAAAESALAAADAALAEADQRVRATDRDHARAESELRALEQRSQALQREIAEAGVPADLAAVDEALATITQLDEDLRTARVAEREARTTRRDAAARAAEAEERVHGAWEAFDATWQSLADLGPPSPDRDDLAMSWRRLTDWAGVEAPRLQTAVDAAREEADAARAAYREQLAALQASCREHGVPLDDDRQNPRDAAVRELERARGRAARIAELIIEAAEVREQHAAAVRDQRVARDLGQHLDAKRFERWLMNRALQRLVAGATRILHELSGGAYSLGLDDQNTFQVIDHRNADEFRSARTLSGGETFLASLSLALALSEHVADLAAHGAARLESLILDEGFGSLDADTLDVVATTLEELGSRGRMIGVITHVPSLAERLPVRYDVRKEAGTSTIERMS